MRPAFWLRVAAAISVIVTVMMALAYAYVVISGQHTIRLADFLAYYTAGTMILHGHGASLYSFAAVGHAEARITYPLTMPGGVSPFIYPPWFAVVMTPLALLPYAVAYAIWFSGNALFAGFSLVLLGRYAGLHGAAAVLSSMLGLSFLPVFAAFGQGQVSLLLLALLVCILWALRSGHDVVAGVALALLLIKPQYALPVAGVLLLRRHWSLCGIFAICTALLVVLPMPFLGTGIEGAYVKGLIHLSRLHGNAGYMAPPPANYSLQGWLSLLVPSYSALARYALIGAAFALTVWGALRDRDVQGPVALAVLFGLLASPHVLVYDVSLLILPLLLLLGRGYSWAPVAAIAYLAPLAGLLSHLSVVFTVSTVAIAMVAVAYSTRQEARFRSETGFRARSAMVGTG